jgi:hypothetical protein
MMRSRATGHAELQRRCAPGIVRITVAITVLAGSSSVHTQELIEGMSANEPESVGRISAPVIPERAGSATFGIDFERLSAVLRHASTDDRLSVFTVRGEAQQTPAAATSAPRQSWARKHPVILGTAIGIGAGLLVESWGCGLLSCYGLITAPIAGAGSYGGLVVSAVQKAHAKEPISGRMKALLVAGAVGAGVTSFLFCYGVGGCGGVS